jgi:hypothetical protein
MINLNKQYNTLHVFGCSFTTGFFEGKNGSWGTHLANKLNCKCEIHGMESSSNYNMISELIEVCESNDMTNNCVGLQFTERCRREIWLSDEITYLTYNLNGLLINDEENLVDQLKFMKKNVDYFAPILFDDRENLLRTIISIITIKNYLKSKGIDFVMFEGISTIGDDLHYVHSHNRYTKLLSKEYRNSLLNEKTFFSKYGPMQPFDRTHPLYDKEKNGGHPNSEFVKWWVDEMYEQIKNNQ